MRSIESRLNKLELNSTEGRGHVYVFMGPEGQSTRVDLQNAYDELGVAGHPDDQVLYMITEFGESNDEPKFSCRYPSGSRR